MGIINYISIEDFGLFYLEIKVIKNLFISEFVLIIKEGFDENIDVAKLHEFFLVHFFN